MLTGSMLVAVASLLVQAPDPAGAAPAQPAPPPGDLLAGPRVPPAADAPPPGAGPREPFAPGRRGQMANPRQWFAILEKIDLRPEQRQQADAIRGEWRQAITAFEQAHGARLRELNEKAGGPRPPGPDMSGMSEPERNELRELRDLRPRPDAYLMRIWTLLDEPQQEQLRRLLAEARAQRRPRGGPGDRGGRDGPPGPGMEPDPMAPGAGPPPPPPGHGPPGLDPMARRRMDFLRRHQLPQRPAPPPPDAAPADRAPGSPPAAPPG